MGWNDLYIIIAFLGFGVFLAGARTLRGYNRISPNLDDVSEPPQESLPEQPGEAGCDTHATNPPRYLTVSFSKSGRQLLWDPDADSLLDFIHSKGIDVDCLCRAGECGACRTKVLEGEVTYLQAPKVRLGEGYCLLCISLPKSDLVLDR